MCLTRTYIQIYFLVSLCMTCWLWQYALASQSWRNTKTILAVTKDVWRNLFLYPFIQRSLPWPYGIMMLIVLVTSSSIDVIYETVCQYYNFRRALTSILVSAFTSSFNLIILITRCFLASLSVTNTFLSPTVCRYFMISYFSILLSLLLYLSLVYEISE